MKFVKSQFQKHFSVLLSLMLNAPIAQSEITEFYFSENSWRKNSDESAFAIKQFTRHEADLSKNGSDLVEELKNAEYLSPLPSLAESYADGVHFVVEESFPLRSAKAVLQVDGSAKVCSRHDTRNFIAHVNADGNVVISQNFRPETGKSNSMVVLTYLDDIDMNAAALVVADTHAIRYSATDAILTDQKKSTPGENRADVKTAAFFSDEFSLLVQAFLLFSYIAFVCLLRSNKKPLARQASAKQALPPLIPEQTVFLENKVLLDLVRSPKIPTGGNT